VTLPELRLADWRATKDTLHLYCQIAGKIRLATTTPRNHWWNAPLYVDVRGLTTRRLHHCGTTFEITIDFTDHALVVRTADGRTRSFGLGSGLPVADFDARLHALLGELGIEVAIREEPFGVPMTTPFAQDVTHASWDREAIERFGRILDWSDSVFEEFSGWFKRQDQPGAPVLAQPRPRGDPVLRPPGAAHGRRPGHARGLHARGHLVRVLARRRHGRRRRLLLLHRPRTRGLRDQPLTAGAWTESGSGSLAILPYQAVRSARDPRTTLLAFCQSAYEAGARVAGWDTASFTSTWCPSPDQLRQLHASAAAGFGRTEEGGS